MFFDSDLLMSALRALTPILLAALGGAICERAGVFNIGLEGMMLMGCFTAVATSWFTDSPWLGVLAAALASAAYSLILAVGAVTLRGDPVVLGIALNLLAVGLTSFLLRTVFGVQGTFDDPSLAGLPLVGGFSPLAYLAWAAVGVAALTLSRHVWGLRLRGVGEAPDAAATLGVSPEVPVRGRARLRCAVRARGGPTRPRQRHVVLREHDGGARLDRRGRGDAGPGAAARCAAGGAAVRARGSGRLPSPGPGSAAAGDRRRAVRRHTRRPFPDDGPTPSPHPCHVSLPLPLPLPPEPFHDPGSVARHPNTPHGAAAASAGRRRPAARRSRQRQAGRRAGAVVPPRIPCVHGELEGRAGAGRLARGGRPGCHPAVPGAGGRRCADLPAVRYGGCDEAGNRRRRPRHRRGGRPGRRRHPAVAAPGVPGGVLPEAVLALQRAAREAGAPHHRGIVWTRAAFQPGLLPSSPTRAPDSPPSRWS